MKVLSVPHVTQLGEGESGIHTVIRSYDRIAKDYGIEFVPPNTGSFDVLAIHAGLSGEYPANGPTVAHTHGLYWTADYSMPPWAFRANHNVIKTVRHSKIVTVPSRWVAETFQRDMRINPTIVPHGIDWDAWQHDREPGGYVVGYAKNRAGVDVCNPEFLADFAATMSDVNFVATFAPDHSPSNVKTTGVIPHIEMKHLVQGANVFMNTTKETWGIAMLEAMASGVPVLAFDHGGAAELVRHGVTGYLARPNDYEDLANGLSYCLNHRAILGANARAIAKEYTWDNAMGILHGVYSEAMRDESATTGIVIPVYNKPLNQIARAIESSLNQTRDVKIVVVDDGSSDHDDVEELITDYYTDKGVKYIYQENAGVAEARNRGVKELEDCKYILCLDADDSIAPQFIEVCVEALEKDNSLGIAYTGLEWHKPDGTTGLSAWPGEFDYGKHVNGQNQVPTASVFRRDAWERTGGYHARYAPDGCGEEDANFWLRIGSIGYSAKKVTDAGLFKYSWQSGYVSGNSNHRVTDWRYWLPWTRDEYHPFASVAPPKSHSHPVRQYDEPAVSVVIPVGPEHFKYVPNALDSLEAQEFRQWEAIVVWDASPPEEWFDWFIKAYPYARNLHSAPYGQGAGVARNLGVDEARGEYLLFLDADDHLHPECIDKMLYIYGVYGSAVYTDYLGKAIVDDTSALAQDLQHNIVQYNEKTKEAIIKYSAADYDCNIAARQPGNTPFIWNNVTTLIPTAWHYEIGGFDESLQSWEDVDYWWRMAWAGKCFHRIEEPLMVYRFHTGMRRERGLSNWDSLLAVLKEKKGGIQVMPCNCGGKSKSRPKSAIAPEPNAQMARMEALSAPQTRSTEMVDSDLDMVTYMHPNRGQHPVYGAATKTFYGFRAGGGIERFLVHRRDIAANPQYFQVLSRVPTAPRVPVPEPTAPALVTDAEPPPEIMAVPVETEEEVIQEIQERVLDNARFDLQLLPGVTDSIAKGMADAGLNTPKAILDAGVRALFDVHGIGPARAKAIYEYVKDRFGDNA